MISPEKLVFSIPRKRRYFLLFLPHSSLLYCYYELLRTENVILYIPQAAGKPLTFFLGTKQHIKTQNSSVESTNNTETELRASSVRVQVLQISGKCSRTSIHRISKRTWKWNCWRTTDDDVPREMSYTDCILIFSWLSDWRLDNFFCFI
jgi:hypothetical protein